MPVVVFVNGVVLAAGRGSLHVRLHSRPEGCRSRRSVRSPGSPAGGDTVQILGGTSARPSRRRRSRSAAAPAQIIGVSRTQLITVSTPTHILANPAVSEACDVVVTRDIGLVSQQSATRAEAVHLQRDGRERDLQHGPELLHLEHLAEQRLSRRRPVTVTITGSGFGSNAGAPARGLRRRSRPRSSGSISNTSIVVSSPRRTLANPDVPETVDVTVTDLGSVNQRCARVSNGFVYTRGGPRRR